jgi:hypothetical protein
MAVKAELELRELLLMTGCLQPMRVDAKGGHLSALCRELKGRAAQWLQRVDHLLRLGEEHDIPLHLCRKYVLKDGKMVFGWHVGIEAKNAGDLLRCLSLIRAEFEKGEMEGTPLAESLDQSPPEEASVAAPASKQFSDKEKADRAENYRKHTQGVPRMAENIQADPVPPPGYEFSLRVVEAGSARNRKGQMEPVEVIEFPLPHVFGNDMNVSEKVPGSPIGRGRGASGV